MSLRKAHRTGAYGEIQSTNITSDSFLSPLGMIFLALCSMLLESEFKDESRPAINVEEAEEKTVFSG